MHYFHRLGRNTKTIITGLSYGLDGIDCKYMRNKAYYFSIHSQDIYCDIKNIHMALDHDQDGTIKDCIFTFGYYSLFYDLSKTGTRRNCLDIYYPLFHDMHHCEDELPDDVKERLATAVRIPDFVAYYHNFFLDNGLSFYGRAIELEDTVPDIKQKGGWSGLSMEDKILDADNLAKHHNRHIGYLERIDPLYKIYIFNTLDQFKQAVNFIDFNDYELFSDDDFLNSDHLNKQGALKLTGIVDDLING